MFDYDRNREKNKKRRIERKILKAQSNKIDNGKPYLTIFSGAGISKESGISTFRSEDGLWNNHSIYEVATLSAYKKDPKFVTNFYNDIREKISLAKPNEAHFKITELEKYFNVNVVTQNIDDLHERAGNNNVIHLHGEINKLQSLGRPNHVVDIPKGETFVDYNLRDKSNSPLRPHVVFFGERPLNIDKAKKVLMESDIVIVVGTSLNVEPAASLLSYVYKKSKIYSINPEDVLINSSNVEYIKENATTGMLKIFSKIIDNDHK